MGLIYDMEVRKDVKGGSPRTPSRRTPVPAYQHAEQSSSDQLRDIEREVNVSLREFFESQLIALDRRTEQASADARQALAKAETALERRLDLLNEFRAQASEESKKYVQADVYNTNHETLRVEVNNCKTSISRLYGGIVVVGMIGVANLVKLWMAH